MHEHGEDSITNLNSVYLRTCIEVSESGNFSKAANHLGISQQVVSNHVRSVEEKLQVQLFDRQNTGARLTRSGATLLPYMKQVISATESLVARAQDRTEQIRVGEVRSRRMLLKIWQEHKPKYPDHRISFHDLTGDEQLERLKSGDLDVAMHAATRVDSSFRQAILKLDPVKFFHIQPFPEIPLATSVVGYTLSSRRYSSWENYCRDLAERVGAQLFPVSHDITMLEAIGQEMIHDEIPPVIALEGMEEYAEAEHFHFQYFSDCQPYYPWGISIRRNEVRSEVLQFFESSLSYSKKMGWLQPIRSRVPQLLPSEVISDPRLKAFH